MKTKLGILLIGLWVLICSSFGQTNGSLNQVKKVAILEPVDKQGNVEYYLKSMLRGKLTKAVTLTSGYEAYDRADIDNILKEQDFQRTGLVGENVIEMGKFNGVSYILIAEIVKAGNEQVYITAKILNVQTTKVDKIEDQRAGISPEQMEEGCSELVGKLFGRGGGNGSSQYGGSGNYVTRSGQDYVENTWGLDMKMVWVEGGSFLMGCTSEQGADCEDDEKNVRRVTLDGYYIGKFEVTQGQWEKVMGQTIYQQRNKANPKWTLNGVGDNYPMYYVSWDEATSFCEELSRRTGKKYRLPTEAQWEYAARDGNRNGGSKYSGGSLGDMVAWYKGNSGGSTHPVGTKRDNLLGIYDMSGKVWEWCRDWYGEEYSNAETRNPQGPSSGNSRMNRGGGYSDDVRDCRVSCRGIDTSNERYANLGFRIVCEP